MPRVFPSQIITYLRVNFKTPDNPAISSYGPVAGFLELYDRLPSELIHLHEGEYAKLVAAIADIRFALDRFRLTNQTTDLRAYLPRALETSWKIIATLKDEVPATTHDLSFITDQVLRDMIGQDIAAISTNLQNGEWKGGTILAGSCSEALLLYGLQVTERKTPNTIASAVAAVFGGRRAPIVADLTDKSWDLYSYTEVAAQIGIIRSETRSELDLARDYRNLIHPAKSVREQVRCDRGTAYIAVGALEHVVSDLKKNL